MTRVGCRAAFLIGSVGVLVAVGSATALGAWRISPVKAAVTVKAAQMAGGPKPTATRTLLGVRISWTAVAPGGVPVTGYRVARYTVGHPDQTDPQRCAVAQATQCLDSTVKAGQTYTYTVRAVHSLWVGNEGDRSNSLTITLIPLAAPAAPDSHQEPTPTPGDTTTSAPHEAPTQAPPSTDPPGPHPSTDPLNPTASGQPSAGASG